MLPSYDVLSRFLLSFGLIDDIYWFELYILLWGDAGMPAPCNPWGGDVGDDLSFAMPNYCRLAEIMIRGN